jgi:hypothetical protein
VITDVCMEDGVPARSRGLSVILVVLLALSACTSGEAETSRSPKASTTHAAARGGESAEVAAPHGATTVLDAAPGEDSTIATSAALFRRAPAVVVATEGDRAATRSAASLATRLGAPVLLAPAADSPHRTHDASAVRREVDRLGAGAVLATGTDAARFARIAVHDMPVRVVDVAGGRAELPDVTPPRPLDLTLLVDANRDDAAAIATAKAAGATVIPVAGGDPRADRHAIWELNGEKTKTVVAVGSEFGSADRLRGRLEVTARGALLPGGGQRVLPGRRIVCLYGHPGAPALGVLGEQGVAASVSRAQRLAAAYRGLSDVPVVPAFELITTVAQGAPGPDGNFSGESTVAQLRPWVDAAANAGLYVLLDLQPGRADLLSQARAYEPLLRLPHVGLAVDPEWKLGPHQRPLGQIGGIDAAELNRTSAWLADLTAREALPQKLFVVHQFRLTMIRHEDALDTSHDELAMLIHMDGQGSTAQKNSTWHSVVTARPSDLPLGWKNFYDEDHPMLTPAQTMTKRPAPVMISYQ